MRGIGDSMDGSVHITVGLPVLLILIVLIMGMAWSIVRAVKSRDRSRNEGEDRRGSMDFVIETFHDLMAQLKAKEEELERLRAVAEDRADTIQSASEDILRSVPSGVVTLDRDLRILTMNPAAREILGVPEPAEGQSQSVDDLGQAIASAVRRALAGEPAERRRIEVRTQTRHPGRGGLLVGMSVSELRNNENETTGSVIVFNDLTAIRELEERVRLREQMTHLGEMSAGIAHELRNPMGVIAGYADLLAKNISEDDPRSKAVGAIREEIRTMNRVIKEFLDFAGPMNEPNRAPVAVRDLVETVLETCEDDSGSIETQVLIDPALTVFADEMLLKQALWNLIRNAREAMTPGGGVVSVSAEDADTATVRIHVADSGPGLPPEDIRKIFLPFHTTKDGGTGLGLSIVHKIVTCHGGSISARNRTEGGAVFTVELPSAPAQEQRVSIDD